MKVFGASEVESVMECIGGGYFAHYLLLQNYRCFSKREDQIEQHIYMPSPLSFTNKKDTHFVDLSEKEKKEEPEA